MNATGSVLLDTTIVVDHLRGKSPVLNAHINQTTTLYLPVTALGELLYGAHRPIFEAKALKQIESFVQLCAVLGTDERTAHYYGQLSSPLPHLPKPTPPNQLSIAPLLLSP